MSVGATGDPTLERKLCTPHATAHAVGSSFGTQVSRGLRRKLRRVWRTAKRAAKYSVLSRRERPGGLLWLAHCCVCGRRSANDARRRPSSPAADRVLRLVQHGSSAPGSMRTDTPGPDGPPHGFQWRRRGSSRAASGRGSAACGDALSGRVRSGCRPQLARRGRVGVRFAVLLEHGQDRLRVDRLRHRIGHCVDAVADRGHVAAQLLHERD